jgi:hypothetical protein
VAGETDEGESERHDCEKVPTRVETCMRHEVPKNDGDEEATNRGEREHEAHGRANELVLNV